MKKQLAAIKADMVAQEVAELKASAAYDAHKATKVAPSKEELDAIWGSRDKDTAPVATKSHDRILREKWGL